jgi:MFS family permease
MGDPAVRRGLAYLCVVGATVTASEATAVAYSRQVLHRGTGVAGILGASVAAAMVVTVALVPRSGGPRRLLQVSAGIGALICLGGGAALGIGHLVGAIVGYVLVGALAGTTTGAQVAFQPRIDPAVRVGVFSLLQGGLQGSQGAAAALGGVLLGVIGGRSALLAVLLATAAVLGWWVLRPIADPQPPAGTATVEDGARVAADALDAP